MLKKITTGFVIQDFDEKTGKCVSQEFVAGDQVDWENEDGESIEAPGGEGFIISRLIWFNHKTNHPLNASTKHAREYRMSTYGVYKRP